MAFGSYRSIHGRTVGFTSTGGLASYFGLTGKNSTAIAGAAQMWGPGFIETVSSNGAAIANSGLTIISTDSTSGAAFAVGAPVAGVEKLIHLQTSATALSLGTTATTIKFNSTLAEAAAGGSTVLNLTGGAAGIGGMLVLRGISTTIWAIQSQTMGVSS